MPLVLDEPLVTYGSGAVGIALPGSRQAIPTDILTTRYEVNGLILNERDNLEHYWIESFNGLYDAEVRDGRETNIDRHGETFYGGLYSGKPLILEGHIKAHTLPKLEDMSFALTEAFDPLEEEYRLIGRTGDFERDWLLWVVKTASLDLVQKQDSMMFKRRFMVNLRASRPNIYSYQIRSASLNLNDDTTLTVTNKGNREAEPRILVFGETTDLSIYNPRTSQTFILNGTVPAGRYYEIDFAEDSILDDLDNNHFSQYEPTSDWLKLARRETQTLTITAGGKTPSSSVTIFWRDTYK